MKLHLSARGHKGGIVKGDCGISLADAMKTGDSIMIGKTTDWKGAAVTFCPDCVLAGETVPDAERAK